MTYSEQLEREAEQTRAAFERTLEELRARITPGQIMDQLMEYARSGTAGDFIRNLGQRTVDNPLPLMMVGAGLAWLVLANGRAAGPSAGTIAESTRSAASRVSETARSASSAMGDFAQRAKSQIGGDRSTPQLGQTEARRSGLVSFVGDHPVVLVGLGLAIGAAIGAAITPAMGMGTRRGEEEEAKERVGHMGEAAHSRSDHHEDEVARERVGHMGEAAASGTQARAGEGRGRRTDGSGKSSSRPEGTAAL